MKKVHDILLGIATIIFGSVVPLTINGLNAVGLCVSIFGFIFVVFSYLCPSDKTEKNEKSVKPVQSDKSNN